MGAKPRMGRGPTAVGSAGDGTEREVIALPARLRSILARSFDSFGDPADRPWSGAAELADQLIDEIETATRECGVAALATAIRRRLRGRARASIENQLERMFQASGELREDVNGSSLVGLLERTLPLTWSEEVGLAAANVPRVLQLPLRAILARAIDGSQSSTDAADKATRAAVAFALANALPIVGRNAASGAVRDALREFLRMWIFDVYETAAEQRAGGEVLADWQERLLRDAPPRVDGEEIAPRLVEILERVANICWTADVPVATYARLRGGSPPTPYTSRATFDVGAWLEHPTFGTGIVTASDEKRIDVQFGDETRTLVHRS